MLKILKNFKISEISDRADTRYMMKYVNIIIIFILILNIAVVYYSIGVIKKQAQLTISEISLGYGEFIDKDYYCRSINCRYILQNIANTNEYTLIDLVDVEVTIVDTPPHYVLNGFDIFIPVTTGNDSYYMNISGHVYTILEYVAIVYIIILFLVYRMISGVLRIERNDFLSTLHKKESDLQHNTLFNTTANINHEVNSPLLVIKSVIDDIMYDINKLTKSDHFCSGSCPPIVKMVADITEMLSIASESVESIESAIRPLSDYKSIRFTNGDKNVHMICDIALKMLKRTNITMFNDVIIDDELTKYSVYHDDGMTNGFFLNIMINHIKNSLEAHASRMSIVLHHRDKTHLHIHIVDNGIGVPPDMVNEIYKANITTKTAIEEYSRGVGLYLNKLLINSKYGGDDTLVSSLPGIKTIFCIKLKYEKYKYHNKDVI